MVGWGGAARVGFRWGEVELSGVESPGNRVH